MTMSCMDLYRLNGAFILYMDKGGVQVVRMLAGTVVSAGVFDEADWNGKSADSYRLFINMDFCGNVRDDLR